MRIPEAVKPTPVLSCDLVHDQLLDSQDLKLACVVDEGARKCLAIEWGGSLHSQDLILTLSRPNLVYGRLSHTRSDNAA
jgi:hypothetical protein